MTLQDVPEQLLRLPSQVSDKSTESCLASAVSARSLVTTLVQEDRWRSYQRAVVDGCYDGNQPYNQAKLNRDGMGWCCNLNWLGMEGRIDGARIPYYALFSGVPTYATFKTYEGRGSPESARWNNSVAEYFTCALKEWGEGGKEFNWHMQASQFELLYEGWGTLIREDDTDFKFRAVAARDVLVPQRSPSCLDKRVPYVVVRIAYRISELWDKIRNEKTADDLGWNVEVVKKAIMFGTRGADGVGASQYNSWEVWQQKFKNREFEMSFTESDFIACAHLFVQEYSGKISHFIVCESLQADDMKDENAFLFKHTNKFDSYSQVLHVGFQNTGRGQWHGVRGMGVKSFKAEETMNRLNCRAVDNAFLESGFTLQPQDNRSQDKLQMMVTHGVNWIPAGVNYIDRNASTGRMEGVLSVSRFLDNQLSQKLGNFQQRSIGRDDGRGEQPTATQVELSAAKETALSNGQIDNYYNFLDEVYTETYRRMLRSSDPIAKRFRERCEAAGVPKEAMDKMEYVRANRLSGYGSPQMRIMQLDASKGIVPMLNEQGKQAWLNEYISATQGPDKVNQWNPPMQEVTQDDAWIEVENGTLTDGIKPRLTSGQNDTNHLEGHLNFADEYLMPLAQAMEQGQNDPAALQEAYTFVQVLGPHCEEHLARLQSDPFRQDAYKYFREKLRDLGGFNSKIFAAIRQAQRDAQLAQSEQQAAMALGVKDQAELASMQSEQQRKDYATQQDQQRKTNKAVASQSLKTWQVGQQSRLAAIQTAAKIQNERALTAAKAAKAAKNGSDN